MATKYRCLWTFIIACAFFQNGNATDLSNFVTKEESPLCGPGVKKPWLASAHDFDKSRSFDESVTIGSYIQFPECGHLAHGWNPAPQIDTTEARVLKSFFFALTRLKKFEIPLIFGDPVDYFSQFSECKEAKEALEKGDQNYSRLRDVTNSNWVKCMELADTARAEQYPINPVINNLTLIYNYLISVNVMEDEQQKKIAAVVLMIEDSPAGTYTLSDVVMRLGLK